MYYEADPRHVDLLAESLGITIANSVCSPGVKNPVVTREPESKSDDNDSSTMQSGDKVESAVSAHATHQSLKPSELQSVHERLCALTDDYKYIEIENKSQQYKLKSGCSQVRKLQSPKVRQIQ